ncbi:MAG: hypothetical protein HRU09_06555 [Oligoflexales bacterium]|nr:hypothetical protein [Oligoflexales bacterium]
MSRNVLNKQLIKANIKLFGYSALILVLWFVIFAYFIKTPPIVFLMGVFIFLPGFIFFSRKARMIKASVACPECGKVLYDELNAEWEELKNCPSCGMSLKGDDEK